MKLVSLLLSALLVSYCGTAPTDGEIAEIKATEKSVVEVESDEGVLTTGNVVTTLVGAGVASIACYGIAKAKGTKCIKALRKGGEKVLSVFKKKGDDGAKAADDATETTKKAE